MDIKSLQELLQQSSRIYQDKLSEYESLQSEYNTLRKCQQDIDLCTIYRNDFIHELEEDVSILEKMNKEKKEENSRINYEISIISQWISKESEVVKEVKNEAERNNNRVMKYIEAGGDIDTDRNLYMQSARLKDLNKRREALENILQEKNRALEILIANDCDDTQIYKLFSHISWLFAVIVLLLAYLI